MKLSTLANYSLAITNGSHQQAGTIGKTAKTKLHIPKQAGIGISSPTVLKKAVTKVCGVRRVLPGSVTALLRNKYATDTALADERRQAHAIAEQERKARGHIKKGVKFNTVCRPKHFNIPLRIHDPNLTIYTPFYSEHGRAFGAVQQRPRRPVGIMEHAKMTCYAYLKRQFSAREARAALDKFLYPQIGPNFRDKHGKKLKMTPSQGEDKLKYIKELVLLMMQADTRRQPAMFVDQTLKGLVRINPIISSASTDPISIRAKEKQDSEVGLKATQMDDPWLVTLDREYVNKLCFLHDISLRHKLYRIFRIAYWPSTKTRYASWEGTMEPVHEHPDGTLYRLDEDVVRLSNGATMTRAKNLIGYILAEYIDGDDSEPTRSDCVDRYAFNAIEKHHAYLLKTRTTHTPAT